MSKRYGLIAVEGPHDRATIGRVLRALGFRSFKDKPRQGRVHLLDPFWEPWLPHYPVPSRDPKGSKLYAPIKELPEIWEAGDWSVGVYSAGGSDIYKLPYDGLFDMPEWLHELEASRGVLAVLVDADNDGLEAAWQKLSKAWTLAEHAVVAPWPWPVQPGEIGGTDFRVGAFIIPNNGSPGTIDSILVPVGQAGALAELVQQARVFVHQPGFDRYFSPSKPFDRLKATVAAAVSLLKPGWPNASSIEEDAWITSWSLEHEALAPLSERLRVCVEQLEALAGELEGPELADLAGQPFDRLRATVAAATSLLRPGAANAVGIEQGEWFDSTALEHPDLQPLASFLRRLLELPAPP